MKVNSVNNTNNHELKAAKNNNATNLNNPNFKGLVDVPGIIMNGVENGGFAASFLIQDMAGMTAPRCREGLYRGIDKEDRKNTKLKDMNFKEGAEVFIREALSGPVMMFSPMIALALGKKYIGKSTFTNSAMINRLGNKLKEVVRETSREGIDVIRDAARENTAALKKEFYKKNISDIAKSTTNATNKEAETEFVNRVVESLETLDRYDEKIANATTRKWRKRYSKAQERERGRLLKTFNDFHKTHSSDLDRVNRVNYDGQVFSTGSFIDGMRGYAHDTLKGKQAAEITEQYANTAKNKALAKRALVNASAILATIGSLSVVPKLYKLVNPVPPGALDTVNDAANTNVQQPAATKQPTVVPQAFAQQPQVAQQYAAPQVAPQVAQQYVAPMVSPQIAAMYMRPAAPAQASAASSGTLQSNQQPTSAAAAHVSFTGKWDAVARHLEFNGNQFTPALMTGLAATALIPPRVRTAIKRAPEDPTTKKKDRSEVGEVLARDITSTAAVTFGVPMLSNAIIASYENKSGFVLKRKPDKPLSTFKKALNLLNPFSAYSYYNLQDLNQIYGNVDTKEKLNSFSEFIDNNGGSLAKVFKTEKKTEGVFSEYGLNMKELASAKDRKAANQKIREKLADPEFAQKMIDALTPEEKESNNFVARAYKSTKKAVKKAFNTIFNRKNVEKTVEKAKPQANKMLKRARSLNSMVSCAATFFLVPAFLGVVLPRMVYGMTAKKQKALHAAQQNQQSAPQVPPQQPAQQQVQQAA